jgi:tRNA modification GTPase
MQHAHVEKDTIAAIATAAGGGVGIIRLSGPDAISLAARLFRAAADDWHRHPRLMAFGRFVGPGGEVLDEGLAVAFHAPGSYTGEDVVELHLHGGTLHLARCLEVILSLGARLADPGEFTRRAFLNGKIDLTRAEAVADLVAAKTDLALRQARAHLRGALHERVMALRERLLDLRAGLEVNLDFPDEDVPLVDPGDLALRAEALGRDCAALADTWRRGRLLRDGARVVLAGSPNAGKSSLFNALLAYDRAIVTPIPGTTRDTLEETLDVLGIPVVLVDTAGLRATSDVVEALGVSRTESAIAAADLVLRLVPPGESAPAPKDNELVVYSKCDLRPAPEGALGISATLGEGLAALNEAIAQRLGQAEGDGLVIVRERQRQLLEAAAEGARRASRALLAGLPAELPAVDLQDAMDALHALVGRTTIEDVLDRLFSTFCIGK